MSLKVVEKSANTPLAKQRKVEVAKAKLMGLIRASVSVIWVKCTEEMRFERQLLQMARALAPARLVRFWSTTQGVTGPYRKEAADAAPTGEERINVAAKNPLLMLEWAMSQARVKGGSPLIVVARDFHVPLRADQESRGQAPGILIRAVRDAVRTLRSAPNKTSLLILSASGASAIPGDLQAELGYVEWPLPDREDVGAILTSTVRSTASLTMPENGEKERLIDASLGLAAEQIANAFAISAVERGTLDADTVLAAKAEEVRKLGLVYIDPDPTRKIGGYANLKKWLQQMKMTLSPKAREYGLEPPKGVFLAGVPGCLAADVTVPDPTTGREIAVHERWLAAQPFVVWARDYNGDAVPALALPPVRYPKSKLLRFHFDNGESITVTPKHRFFVDGHEIYAEHVARLHESVPVLLDSTSDISPAVHPEGGLRSVRTSEDSQGGCLDGCGSHGERLHPAAGTVRALFPSQAGALARTRQSWPRGDQGGAPEHTRSCQSYGHLSTQDFSNPDCTTLMGVPKSPYAGIRSACASATREGAGPLPSVSTPKRTTVLPRQDGRLSMSAYTPYAGEDFPATSSRAGVSGFPRAGTPGAAHAGSCASVARLPSAKVLCRGDAGLRQFARESISPFDFSSSSRTIQEDAPPVKVRVIAVEDAGEAEYYDFHVPLHENYFAGGVWNHNCGKSLSAIITANEWLQPLVKVDMSAMLGKYVGESEEKTDRILTNLSAMAPCIALVDEVEKVFAGMGGGDASDGGVKRGVFGKFLSWLNDQSGVFVMATANDVQGLLANAPEFTRKGRFDEMFFVDLPNDTERMEIAAIHIARRGRASSKFDLDAISKASVGLSGAEIEDAIKSALRISFIDGARELTTEDILTAVRSTVPLSKTAGGTINTLREWAKGRCVPATPPDAVEGASGEGDVGARNLDIDLPGGSGEGN